MSQSMPSECVQLLIAGYVLGDLSADEATVLASLVAENPAIEAEITALQLASEQLQTMNDVTPPASLRARVMESVQLGNESGVRFQAPDASDTATDDADTESAISSTSRAAARRSRSRVWMTGGAIAATVLIAGLGLSNYRLRTALQAVPVEDTPSEPVIYTLSAPDSPSESAATVSVNPETLEAQVSAQNLPALPAGKIYAVWTLPNEQVPATTDEKGAILSGLFQVDAQGNADSMIVVPTVHRNPDGVAKVAITMEDAASPQQHIGSVVVIAQ